MLDEFQPHLVLTTHADVLDEDTVDRLRGRSAARWVTWLVDDLRTVTQATALARPYDAIYAVGTDVAAEVGERLGRTVDVLSNAADPSVYRPLRTKDQYRANVVFAGTATPRRERLLGELVEFGLAVWGPGWRRTALKDYCRGEVPGTEAYVHAYGGASVAINIHHVAVEGDLPEASCNVRLFELAAMGLPQVVDDRGDLARHFAPGREVAVYRDGRELRAVVRALRQRHPQRPLRVLFQPHQASRTRCLMREFASVLAEADSVWMPPIYFSRDSEEARRSVKSGDLVRHVRNEGGVAEEVESLDELVDFALERVAPGDVVITMGAGNIDEVARGLAARL